jgi:membrane protease YdiL (CAAX protease family)
MPGALDLALAALFAVAWPLWTHFVDWPRHVGAVAAGDAGARRRLYAKTIAEQWLLTAAVVALTVANARPLSTLWLEVPNGWRLWLGFGLPLAYAGVATAQLRGIAGSSEARERLRRQLAPLRALVPHDAREWQLFQPLAVTAGVCEELLFRGYLVWILSPWLGVYGAALASVVMFGLAHSYQGIAFAPRAFAAGVAMALLALVTGSVIPGMLLHAAVDLGGGYAAYLALAEEREGATAP